MKTIYWNSDTDVMVMPAGLLDLQKVAALDPRIITKHDINGMDVVSCRWYGTGSAVLTDINYDPKATDSHVVECWYEKDRSRVPYVLKSNMLIEEGYTIPQEVEALLRAYQE